MRIEAKEGNRRKLKQNRTNTEMQQTVQGECTISGRGLMFGDPVDLTLRPASPDAGVVFRRIDLPASPEIRVCPENYGTVVPRCTSVQEGGAVVNSVEHILSALAGLGIDNVKVDISASEPPALDGSASLYVDLINGSGIVQQEVPRRYIEFEEPFAIHEADRQIVLLPSDSLQFSFVYDHPQVSPQVGTFTIDPETYAREIAPARSFCFADEIDLLRSQGIGKGATYDNVIVVEDDGSTSDALRFENEFVRHKILDLIGDLYLAGRRLKANVMALRSGHTLHTELVLSLAEKGFVNREMMESVEAQQIYGVLPHRYPMCMIDRVTQFESGKRAVGLKNLTYNEQFFQGHFPQQPVMPGVLQMEALAQLAAWLLLHDYGAEGQLGYFATIKEARFRRPVIPGDQLRLEVEVLRGRETLARVGGKAYVGDELATEGEITIVLDKSQARNRQA